MGGAFESIPPAPVAPHLEVEATTGGFVRVWWERSCVTSRMVGVRACAAVHGLCMLQFLAVHWCCGFYLLSHHHQGGALSVILGASSPVSRLAVWCAYVFV